KQQAEQAAHALELRHAQDHLIQKEAGVKTAYIYLDDKQDDYNDHYHQDKYYSKFKKAIKNYNRALIERDAAINKLYTLLGMNDRVKTPLVEIPKRATKWEKTKLWIGRNVEINIGINFSAPLYQMKTPGRTDPGYSPPPLPEPQPTAPLPTEAPPTWQEIQNQQIFEMNMAYHSSPDSPNDTSSAPQFPSPTVPTSGTLQIVQPRQLQRAGFVPMDSTQFDGVRQAFDNDLIKSVPKGVARVFSALCNLMLPDMSDVKGAECPKEHFQRAFGRSIEWYDKAAGIQDPNSFSAKTGEFIGEALALGGVGKVIHVVDGISVFGMACEGGFIGAVVAEAHNTNKATGVVFGFAGGAGTAKLTKLVFKQAASRIDRTLPTKPQSFGRQVRTIETLQRQTYRSGVVTERTATKLAEKSISKIQPLKLPAVTPGPELEWLSINTPKIRQLQQLKGDRFDRFIKSTFKDQDLTEVQIRRLLHFSGFKTYPRPAGLPDNVVVEFAKKNGGMAYRKLGTTEEHVRVVRVCQGLGKESMVSSTIKGQIEHGTLRQQYPYVVQRKENLYLRADGTWTDNAKDPLTHIRLGEYQFKGWE
ncbi:MAG: hypothetical protein KDD43_09085, partial [Bdellovibrionales bacterium]|nr:hypothetical protein [Bdellovibrionales bacterium]